MQKSDNKKQIVILGGGFAGMYAGLSISRALGKSARVTVVNKTNHFLFTPMLHEVATGGLGHHQVVEATREIIYKKDITFFEGEVQSVDVIKKEITTSHGIVSYDTLVLALGATTNFFNTPGAQEHSLVLKDLSEAITLRNTIISRFEDASRATSEAERKELLSFVVVGGGPTGVELAGEIAEFAYGTLRKYYRQAFSCKDIQITLVHSGKELLPTFDIKTRAYALKQLQKNGVTVLLATKVKEVAEQEVLLSNETRISAKTTIWTAGVRARDIEIIGASFEKDALGRISTDSAFRVKGHENIFAIGDTASVPDMQGASYPMLAQVAVAEARLLGKNLQAIFSGKEPKPFRYRLKGELVSLGRWKASGTVLGMHIHGKLAWFIWRTVYLFKFISKSKKIKIAMDWTVNLFFSRDVSRI
jgi:NADH dehydrogenase